jgi:hypothetical protein
MTINGFARTGNLSRFIDSNLFSNRRVAREGVRSVVTAQQEFET